MFTIAALYHFTRFDDHAALQDPLLALCRAHGVKGTLLLAGEGINGTIAGSRTGIDAVLAHIRALPGCGTLEWKESTAAQEPFNRMKVRLKREIVTMGQPDVDPLARTGHYVDPSEWNELILAPDVAVIDTRNDYEVAIGTFEGAVDPETSSFGEFPAWWQENKHVSITSGLRCFAPVEFVAKNRPITCSVRGSRMSITLRVASCNIWKMCQKMKAHGTASVSYLTGGFQLATG